MVETAQHDGGTGVGESAERVASLRRLLTIFYPDFHLEVGVGNLLKFYF